MNQQHTTDGEIMLRLRHQSKGQQATGNVPVYYYEICSVATGRVIGQCDLRVGYNDILHYTGHIGYSIEPPHRGNRYAAKACQLLLDVAREKGMQEDIYITCTPDNIPSQKTCEILGAQFLGIVTVPVGSADYQRKDFQKCQYLMKLYP